MTQSAKLVWAVFMSVFILSAPVKAQDIWISPDLPYLDFDIGDEFYLIERGQDNSEFIAKVYPAKAPRECPPHCIQPIKLAEGVTTVGEVEIADFIMDHVVPGDGFVVDARLESWYMSGTIPGAVNLPYNLFTVGDENPFIDQLLSSLGGIKGANGLWTYPNAKYLLLFCNGVDCGQSPRAIKNLLASDYPADHLFYYRGGMKSWSKFGFTIQYPE